MKKYKYFLVIGFFIGSIVLIFNLLGKSNLISKTTTNITTPYVNYAYTNFNGAVTISFSPVKEATSYYVYRKNNEPNSKWCKIAETTKKIIIDTTAKKDSSYYYTVRANVVKNSKSYLGRFDKIGVTNVNKCPQSPTINSVTAAKNGISISWSQSNRASKYIIYRKAKNTNWESVGSTSNTTYIDKNYVPGIKYYYTVKAYKTIDNINYYSIFDKKGTSCISNYPKEPKLNFALLDIDGTHITWNKLEKATSYIILRKDTNSDWTEIGTASNNFYIDKTAKKSKVYYYTIQAVNTVSKRNFYSLYNRDGILMGRLKPDFSVTNINLNYLNIPTITWTKYKNAEGYLVYRKMTSEPDNNYKLIKHINKDSNEQFTDFSIHNKKSGTYTYIIKPYFSEISTISYYATTTFTISKNN